MHRYAVAKLKYVCTVTEYKMKRDKSKDSKEGGDGDGKDGGGSKAAEVSNDERCNQLTQWQGCHSRVLDWFSFPFASAPAPAPLPAPPPPGTILSSIDWCFDCNIS